MPEFKTEVGEKITAYTPTFPARRYWYRHDRVLVDGVPLKGFIQVRHRHGRTETITCFENACVLGRSPEWLQRMNVSYR